jgi:hypothetical protein
MSVKNPLSVLAILALLAACGADESKDSAAEDADTDTDTDADTDTDTDADTDTDTDTDMTLGPDDDYAAAACLLFEGDPTTITAASSQADAGHVLIEPDGGLNYLVERPTPGGDAWVMLEVADWAVDVRFFVSAGTEYELIYSPEDAELLRAEANNGACPDAGIGDQELKIHSWGDYPLHFMSGSEDQIRLTVIQED